VKCEAETWLTEDDWYLVAFYQRVSDQYFNQTPMGAEKGAPPVITPRLEGYEAALRLYRYPRAHWAWLVDGAVVLHRLVNEGTAKFPWLRETGKRFHELTPEDLLDGD